MRKVGKVLMVAMTTFVVGCGSPIATLSDENIQQIKASLAESVNANKALNSDVTDIPTDVLSNLAVGNGSHAGLKKFDVSVNDMPSDAFFRFLVTESKANIIVSPELDSKITLHLRQVSIEDVLKVMRDNGSISYKKTDYGYNIFSRQAETHTYHLNQLNMQQKGESTMIVESDGEEGGKASSTLKTQYHQSDFWQDVSQTVQGMIGDDKNSFVKTNSSTNVLVVKAYPEVIEQVEDYLRTMNLIESKQIMLEAKIMEVSLSNEYKTGIDWQQTGLDIDTSSGSFIFSNPIHSDGLTAVVHALAEQGRVTVLSSPRLSVVNNKQSIIKVGDDSYYLTGINSTVSGESSNQLQTQNLDLETFFSGVSLDIMPNIMKGDRIRLHVHPAVRKVTQDVKSFQIANQDYSFPTAVTRIREADSVVEMSSGETIILGGLMEDETDEQGNYLPGKNGKSKIKTRTNDSSATTELVIVIKATVIDEDRQWNDAMEKAFNSLNDEG